MSEFTTPPTPPAGGGTGGPSGPRADFGLRFVALLIDAILIGVVIGILSIILPRALEPTLLVAGLAYFTYFEGTPSGQTPGKRLMGIRVIDFLTGGELGFAKALIRNVMRMVSGGVCLLGYLWMLWDNERQTWHDKVAASVVVPVSDYPLSGGWPG